jgi:hypothetical protein
MSADPGIPPWLSTYVDAVSEALGLNHITLYYRVKPIATRKKGGNGGGNCKNVPRYNRVSITFDALIAPDADGYETVTHELLHGALAPIEQAVDQIISLLPKAQRKHAWKLWGDGNEPAVTRIAHHLTKVLHAPDDPTEEDHGAVS